ncbi:MAG: hypothetical protein ABIC04_02075 [Nanoarchaeota archaeon]
MNIITMIVTYLGLAVGLIIMKASKEEQKQGIKYFLVAQKAILLLLCIMLLYYLELSFITIITVSAIAIMHNKTKYIYPILGFVFYLSLENLNLLLLVSITIFCYGLVSSAILINFRKKDYGRILASHATFLIVAAILIFYKGF